MKYLLILILLLVVGCVPYTRQDKIALGQLVTSEITDIMSTRQCIQQGGREVNPLLPADPSDRKLYLFKVTDLGLFIVLGEIFPERRAAIFRMGSYIRFGVSIYNYDQSGR